MGTPQQEAQAARLYGGRNKEGLSDQPFCSVYGPRLMRARLANNHIETKRLEDERREFREYCKELELTDSEALQIGSVLARTAAKPLSRKALTDTDSLYMQGRFGPEAPELIQAAATRSNKALENKPTLLDAVRRGGAWVDRGVVETVAEAEQRQRSVAPAKTEE